MVTADLFRVHGFRNVSVTTCSAQSQSKLFANDLQVVTLTDHNDLIAVLSSGTNTFLLEFF